MSLRALTRNPIITPSTQHVASLLIGQDEMPGQARQDTGKILESQLHLEAKLPTVVGIERIPLRVVRGIGLDFQAMADEVLRDRKGRLVVVLVADNGLYLFGR